MSDRHAQRRAEAYRQKARELTEAAAHVFATKAAACTCSI
jgi:hypothetical protein